MSQTLEGQSVSEREARERIRLLYVGFTRAHDHLILAVRHGRQGLPMATRQRQNESRAWFTKSSQSITARPSHWIAPSRAALDWPEASTGTVGATMVIGSRLPLGSERPGDWNVVGDVLHPPALGPPQRLELVRRLLEASELLTLLAPDALLRSADQLRHWIDRYWPDAIWHRELPVTGLLSSAA